MELAVILQGISAAAMTLGMIYGTINLRLFIANRKRDSAMQLLNSFQTTDFVRGLYVVLSLRDGMSKSDVEQLPPDEFIAIFMVMGTWERLGILVYRREIPLQLVDDAFSGPVVQSWQKLGRYIEQFRADLGRDTAMEWFQWLAERIMERENSKAPVPAYLAHRHWKP